MRSSVAVWGKWVVPSLMILALLPPAAWALTASQVYEQVKDSVVVVRAYDQKGQQVSLASGVMLPSGDIITNYHVVRAGFRFTVGQGLKATPAFLTAAAADRDLCLLSVPGLAAPPARLGQAARLKVGEPVYAVGVLRRVKLSLSEGIVFKRLGGPPPLIQTTAAISPASSGGGLFNAAGELVGINNFDLRDSQGMNHAVPVEWIDEVTKLKTLDQTVKVGERVAGLPRPMARLQENWENQVSTLTKAQHWQALLTCSRRWTQAEPGNELAWYSLGTAYGKLGRYREEIEAYQEALRLKPDYPEAMYNIGVAYGNLRRYREAVEVFQEALRFKINAAKASYKRGVAYGNLGRYREEIKAYREALRLKPDYVAAWNNLGVAYVKLGRYPEAIKACREALRLRPDDAEAWNNLAFSYYLSGNRRAALEAVSELRRYDQQRAEKLFDAIIKP
ncbi:MAG: tetratricopeptide repeat protein [Deltaproteobacteria bacterium]|nr:tetratricopeptide repeat protein [Deltaproteobacteria bacterium]